MTPWKLRVRLRQLARKLVGGGAVAGGESAPPPVEPAAAAAPADPPTSTPTPTPTPTTDAPAEPAPPPEPTPPVATEPEPISPTAGAKKGKPKLTEEEKQKRHWDKTRKGVLKWLDEQGGSASMKDMHDFSERKFFIAHRSFSRLMEELTEDGTVTYDATTGVVARSA